MDTQQKRLYAALACLVAAIVVYDIPGMMPCDRVVSNTVNGNFQTVVMDLTKTDPWAVHAWVRQLCYALLCLGMCFVGWMNIGATTIGVAGVVWFAGQAADAFVAGNLFDDGVWEYGLLAGTVAMCSLMIHHNGWKHDGPWSL